MSRIGEFTAPRFGRLGSQGELGPAHTAHLTVGVALEGNRTGAAGVARFGAAVSEVASDRPVPRRRNDPGDGVEAPSACFVPRYGPHEADGVRVPGPCEHFLRG